MLEIQTGLPHQESNPVATHLLDFIRAAPVQMGPSNSHPRGFRLFSCQRTTSIASQPVKVRPSLFPPPFPPPPHLYNPKAAVAFRQGEGHHIVAPSGVNPDVAKILTSPSRRPNQPLTIAITRRDIPRPGFVLRQKTVRRIARHRRYFKCCQTRNRRPAGLGLKHLTSQLKSPRPARQPCGRS